MNLFMYLYTLGGEEHYNLYLLDYKVVGHSKTVIPVI